MAALGIGGGDARYFEETINVSGVCACILRRPHRGLDDHLHRQGAIPLQKIDVSPSCRPFRGQFAGRQDQELAGSISIRHGWAPGEDPRHEAPCCCELMPRLASGVLKFDFPSQDGSFGASSLHKHDKRVHLLFRVHFDWGKNATGALERLLRVWLCIKRDAKSSLPRHAARHASQMMAKGRDVSEFYPDVVRNVVVSR